MSKTNRVPAAMQEKYAAIATLTDSFCKQYLNGEYQTLARTAIAALCRKRPSPLLKGKPEVWAAGILQALGTANFLFDKSKKPYCKASDISAHFGIGTSTAQNKAKEIRDMLRIGHFSSEWMLPSMAATNPLVWMVSVNGFIVDIRSMPVEVQQIAYDKGLIPYVPGNTTE